MMSVADHNDRQVRMRVGEPSSLLPPRPWIQELIFKEAGIPTNGLTMVMVVQVALEWMAVCLMHKAYVVNFW